MKIETKQLQMQAQLHDVGSPQVAAENAKSSNQSISFSPSNKEGNVDKNADVISHTESVTGGTTNPVKTSHSNLKVKPRLRAEGVMAPPASDAATLRRQVAALQADVEAHIEAEQRLQSFNQQLSGRLELYMKQNHENLERAANEMNTLHEDMEQTLELQRRLSKRASFLEGEKKALEQALQNHMQRFEAERTSLQMQVSNLSIDLREQSDTEAQGNAFKMDLEKTQAMNTKLQELLQKNCAEAAFLKLRIEECRNKLHTLLAEENRKEEIEKLYQKALMRRCFTKFLQGLREQYFIESSKRAADGLYKSECCKRGFKALQLATRRSRKMRLANSSQTEAFLRDLWREWRLTTSVQKKYSVILKQQRQSQISKAFYGWKHLLHAFHNQCGQYADLAAKHWRTGLLKRTCDHWAKWITDYSKPKKMQLQDAQLHLNDATLRLALSAWRHVLHKKQKKRRRMHQGLRQRRQWSMKAAFFNWQKALKINNRRRLLREMARCFRRDNCCDAVMRCWHKYVQRRRNVAASKTIALNHYNRCLKSKELRLWKQNAQFQKAETKAMLGFNQALIKTAMGFWQDYHVFQSIKKRREKKATVHRQRTEQKVLRRILLMWWEEMVWTRHASEMQHSLASWWQRILLRTAFHSWMHGTFEKALVTSSERQTDLIEAKEKCETQKHRTTAVDVENLHLIDRLHMMSSEIAYLMTTITEKTKRRQEIQHALEDAALIEGSMRGDLEQQRLRIDELEKEASTLQKFLQKKNSEDVAGEVYHALHIQSLEHALRNVQTQLSQKSSQVESYEKALKDTADKLEGTSDESHQKLSSAFQIAASLRKLLEDRENQCAALEGSCRRTDLELEEVQRKLTLSKCAFVETLDARDSRIHELEKLLLQKQAQIEEVQQDVQDVQLAINIQDGCYKKLEYEIKLNSGEKWQATRERQTCESWLA